jgi:uncharacterized membrane protein YkvA (DUF1232 family)
MRTDENKTIVITDKTKGATGGRAQPSAMRRFGEVVLRLPRYTALTMALLRDERIDRARKGVLVAGLGYLAMPIDLVPGIIPVAGQMDDLAAVLIALRTVLRSLPAEVADQHLRQAGLSLADIDTDLRSLGLAALWIARKAGGWILRGVGTVGDTALERVGKLFGRRGRAA